MRYLPLLVVLVGLVMLMASWGRGGSLRDALRQGRSIVLVIAALFVLAVLFALAASRAL